MDCLYCKKPIVMNSGGNKKFCNARCKDLYWRGVNPPWKKNAMAKWRAKNKKEITEYHKQWRKDNPEKVKANSKKDYTDHAEKIKERKHKRYAEDPSKTRERVRKWIKENPEKIRVVNQVQVNRRKKLEHTLTAEQWKEALQFFDNKCAYCGKSLTTLHMEHFVPAKLGGGLTKENIVPACKTCNSRKGSKRPLDWLIMQAQGLVAYVRVIQYLEK